MIMLKNIISQILKTECYLRKIPYKDEYVESVINNIKAGYDLDMFIDTDLDGPSILTMEIIIQAIKEIF